MKTIKQAIDPLGIFNPGKVCPILDHPDTQMADLLLKLYPDVETPSKLK